MNRLIATIPLFFAFSSFAATTGLSPTSVKITIYGAAVSTNADCSNAVVLNYNPAGTEYDFMQTPSILSGTLAAGSYPCVILMMSDVIKFTPSTTSTNSYCVAGTEYTRDVCRAGQGTYLATTFNADGTVTYGSSTNCTGTQLSPASNQVALFLSTSSTTTTGGGGGNAFDRPTTVTNGFNLASPFVVTGSNSGTFVVNFNGQLAEQGTTCDLNPPTFGFR